MIFFKAPSMQINSVFRNVAPPHTRLEDIKLALDTKANSQDHVARPLPVNPSPKNIIHHR